VVHSGDDENPKGLQAMIKRRGGSAIGFKQLSCGPSSRASNKVFQESLGFQSTLSRAFKSDRAGIKIFSLSLPAPLKKSCRNHPFGNNNPASALIH